MVVPVVEHDDTAPSCNTYTKSMSLKAVDINLNHAACREEACLALVLAISAGSVLISGSIVLTGNTVHWLEYQGTCSDGYLNSAKQKLFDSFGNPAPLSAKLQLQQ